MPDKATAKTKDRPGDQRVMTTFRLEPDLLRQIKIRAALDGTSINALMEQGIRHILRINRENDGFVRRFIIFVAELSPAEMQRLGAGMDDIVVDAGGGDFYLWAHGLRRADGDRTVFNSHTLADAALSARQIRQHLLDHADALVNAPQGEMVPARAGRA
ncbi:hypothetical protein [Nitrospirillum iridis]|uniref:Uncharacterized protein n=1 Tax=Nitrospirillum iridis TaxID=765888 RepID=A0A7X0B3P8_9PROT|nr:hypothetical protein [Nitrospirillum iridis]MBB6255098.1 hypothetical protein [Nitrospirillum iridis]